MERVCVRTIDIYFRDALSTVNVIKKRQFADERWTKGRMISSIAWSPHVRQCINGTSLVSLSPLSLSLQHQGMVSVSYYQLESTTSDPDGVVLMWDLKFNKQTPDHVFNCHVSLNDLYII